MYKINIRMFNFRYLVSINYHKKSVVNSKNFIKEKLKKLNLLYKN